MGHQDFGNKTISSLLRIQVHHGQYITLRLTSSVITLTHRKALATIGTNQCDLYNREENFKKVASYLAKQVDCDVTPIHCLGSGPTQGKLTKRINTSIYN